MSLSAAILAGGKSSRMGRTKAFVEVRSCRIIDHAIDELKQVSSDIMIVTNSFDEYSHLGIRLVKDIVPGLGPLSGIHSALVHAKEPQVLVVACDMPFIEAGLADLMSKFSMSYDVVIPKVEGYFEPLFAVYTKNCIQYIERCIEKGGKLRVVDFFSYVKVKYVNEDEINQVANLEKVFYNVNTPKELILAKKLAEEK